MLKFLFVSYSYTLMCEFVNITQNQKQCLMRLIAISMSQLQANILKHIYLQLDDTQMVKILLSFFASRHQLDVENILLTAMEWFQNKPIDNLNLSIGIDTALGNNYIGSLIKNNDKPVIQQYIDDKPYGYNFLSVMFDSQYKVSQAKIIHKKCNFHKKHTLSKYLKTFKGKYLHNKKMLAANQLQYLDMDFINKQIEKYKNVGYYSNVQQLIEALNDAKYNSQVKNNIYYMLQYVFTLGVKLFNQHIQLPQSTTIIDALLKSNIQTQDDLIAKSQIQQLCKQSQIHFYFNEKLQLDDIEDKYIIALLNKCDQQLLRISANQYILIVHNAKNNTIHKVPADQEQDIQLLKQLTENLQEGEMFDIIYTGNSTLIQDLPLRYLNYIPNKNDQVLTLKYPELLQSCSFQSTTITNLNKCIHLKNIYSYKNTFTKEHLESFKNIKCFSSCYDKYDQAGGFLNEISKNNQLQYAHVYLSSGIIESLSLYDQNTALKYLYVYTDKQPVKLSIDQQLMIKLTSKQIILSSWHSVQWEPREVQIQQIQTITTPVCSKASFEDILIDNI